MPQRKGAKKARRTRKARRTGVQPFGTSPVLSAYRRMRMCYSEIVTLGEAAAGTGAHTTFSLNGLYDPNTGAIGVQPVGFDQMMALYGQYRVWAVNVSLLYQNTQNVSTCPQRIVVFGTYQPAVPSNPSAWFCQPFAAVGSLEPVGGRSSTRLVRKFDIPAVLGLTKQQYTSDMDFVGTNGGNPSRQAYAVIGIQSMAASAAYASVSVMLSYEVEFSQPLALNMS